MGSVWKGLLLPLGGASACVGQAVCGCFVGYFVVGMGSAVGTGFVVGRGSVFGMGSAVGTGFVVGMDFVGMKMGFVVGMDFVGMDFVGNFFPVYWPGVFFGSMSDFFANSSSTWDPMLRRARK